VRAALALDLAHMLGQSWECLLSMELALTHPAGMESLIMASSTASMIQMPQAKEPERYMAILDRFLSEVEAARAESVRHAEKPEGTFPACSARHVLVQAAPPDSTQRKKHSHASEFSEREKATGFRCYGHTAGPDAASARDGLGSECNTTPCR
jgi:pimeloyl-ACP methyl ester carboxylesterase